MVWWEMVVIMLAGIAAGWTNVMAGGGSLLTVPIMLFMGVPGPVANGTNRVAIIAQNITAAVTFFKKGFSDFKLSISLSLAALPGAIVGALVGTELDGIWFNRIVAVVMVVVMFLMATEQKPAANAEAKPLTKGRLITAHICMVGAGFWGGFIQLGVGFLLMPILHRILGLDLVRVNMHKVFVVMVFSVAALAIFASRVEIFWLMGLCLAVGNSIGGWLGARSAIQGGEKLIKRVFNAVMVVFIIKLLFFP